MAETTRTLITDDMRDAVALALAGRANGLASDGLGWYRNEDQVEEFHAQADLALAAIDLPSLRARWVAEARAGIAKRVERYADTVEEVEGGAGWEAIVMDLRALAAEYRDGRR